MASKEERLPMLSDNLNISLFNFYLKPPNLMGASILIPVLLHTSLVFANMDNDIALQSLRHRPHFIITYMLTNLPIHYTTYRHGVKSRDHVVVSRDIGQDTGKIVLPKD